MGILNTFSLAALCPRTGMMGLAISSAAPAVGQHVPFVTEIGVLVPQALTSPWIGGQGLKLLRVGFPPDAVISQVLSQDPERQKRQIGVLDRTGRTATFTGSACDGWAGEVEGNGFIALGNTLTGAETLNAMARTFVRSSSLDLPERLMRALEAGQGAGADSRGKTSSSLRVVSRSGEMVVDGRVDLHPDPVTRLRGVLEQSGQLRSRGKRETLDAMIRMG
ncbi:hypothetical protein OCH239_12620 [Roseivivax halodurans JCM 10272]|uniref:DUF1028 domain-containing protein n=1 Tax=Roseivivax halodurans JCM 10272 TaxID=1449350 RepID=X7EB01_9RHOB|nr:DUF1028 domain-containing protein [Roseivivax halodurans]ETX13264.1 hypothetical protein OCH239_12620 [Roseivivax halodurans JCM 10272]